MSLLANHIRQFEGLRLAAYRDVGGVLTVGFGHTGPDVFEDLTITEAEAERLLAKDMEWATAAVRDSVKVPLTETQEAALVSMVYNIGAGPDGWPSSTTLKRLNAGNYHGAADAMLWWNKVDGEVSNGLVNRREAERDLFLSEIEENEMTETITPTTKVKPWYTSKALWVNAVAALAAVTGAFGLDLGLDPETQISLVTGIMAVVNILLRLVTKTAVGG